MILNRVLKLNICSISVTFLTQCCSEARYPQYGLKWKAPILFWLSGLMIGAKGHVGFPHLSERLGDNVVQVIGGQCWHHWAVLPRPFKLGVSLLLPPSCLQCTFRSTHCAPASELGNKIQRQIRQNLCLNGRGRHLTHHYCGHLVFRTV